MKLTTKKIIAREFLFLTLVVTIGLISYLLTYPYNSVKHRKIEALKTEINHKAILSESLSKPYKAKVANQKWYFQKLNEEFDLEEFNTRERLWKHSIQSAKNDSIRIIWRDKWTADKTIVIFFNKLGFPNGDSLQNFIQTNSIEKSDFENATKSEKLQKEILEIESKQQEILESTLTHQEQLSIFTMSLIISVSLLFVIRHLYYGLKWSFKTLKQKDD